MEKLGINALEIAAQIANIAILIFIFKKFLYKPILKVLEKRQQSIEDNIRLQEQLEARLEALDEKERQMVKRAKVEANKIAEDVRTEAKTSANLLLVAARDEASSIRKQTHEELKRELESERQKLEEMMAKKAAEVANDAIGKLLGEKTRRLLTEKQVSEFVKKSH
jgi:F-type H+-transporting ATPase subunit b